MTERIVRVDIQVIIDTNKRTLDWFGQDIESFIAWLKENGLYEGTRFDNARSATGLNK